MKKRIFRSICVVALFSMLIATWTATSIIGQETNRKTHEDVRREVHYLAAGLEEDGSEYLNELEKLEKTNLADSDNRISRITWITKDGTVIYDSYTSPSSLPNHADRPEVKAALEKGEGETFRVSDTLAEQTYYYAKRLSNGTVIRVASTTRTDLASVIHTVPAMLVMAGFIFAITMALADAQTKRIVKPINELDPDNPQPDQVYEELYPLVRSLQKQKLTIQQQMQTLRKKQEEFTAITENMKEGFIVVDSKANVISYNSSAVRILGVDIESMEHSENGQEHRNVLSFNRSASFREVVNDALNGERGQQNLELNGRYYQLIASPVVESGDKRGAVLVILDVTEQQNREELRREFTANVSHELKTPLTSISGYAEIMKDGLVRPEDMGRFSEKIYSEAQRLITLVGDIIKLSRLDEEKVEIEKTDVDLCQIAAGVVTRLKETAHTAGIEISLTAKPAVVNGASQILDEMIFNLCENAIKYNRPHGRVDVVVDEINHHPTVIVKDTGIGIAEKDQDRIFERFYRVDKSHSRQIGGTGLGLSIVKHGAIYHKAKVEMDSKVGVGTTIRIVFP